MSEFIETVQRLNDGHTETELSHRLQELVEQVRATGKKGALTLTISVELHKGNQNLVVLSDEIKAKSPMPGRPSTFCIIKGDKLIPLADTQQKLFDAPIHPQPLRVNAADQNPVYPIQES